MIKGLIIRTIRQSIQHLLLQGDEKELSEHQLAYILSQFHELNTTRLFWNVDIYILYSDFIPIVRY
jgi:hypothetical protein